MSPAPNDVPPSRFLAGEGADVAPFRPGEGATEVGSEGGSLHRGLGCGSGAQNVLFGGWRFKHALKVDFDRVD